MVTRVDLPDGRFLIYTQPMDDALVCAHAQYVLEDFNTWDYQRRYAGLKELIRDGRAPGSRRLNDLVARRGDVAA